MREMCVARAEGGDTVAARVRLADSFPSRLRGLLWRPPLRDGEGLLLSPCNAVHMWGMKYPIDVSFLDRHWNVVAVYERLGPGKRSRRHRDARHALELPAGTLAAAGIGVGTRLFWTDTAPR